MPPQAGCIPDPSRRPWLWVARVFALWLTASVSATAALAQEVTAGWEVIGTDSYGFTRALFARELDARRAIVFSATASHMWYRYDDDDVGTIRGAAPGIAAAVGYRLSTERLMATLTTGPGLRRWHEREPDGVTTVDTDVGIALEGELSYLFDDITEASGSAGYQGADGIWWTRAQALRELTRTNADWPGAVSGGIEAVTWHYLDVHALQAGLLVGLDVAWAELWLECRFGYAALRYSDATGEGVPYFGIAAYRAF